MSGEEETESHKTHERGTKTMNHVDGQLSPSLSPSLHSVCARFCRFLMKLLRVEDRAFKQKTTGASCSISAVCVGKGDAIGLTTKLLVHTCCSSK